MRESQHFDNLVAEIEIPPEGTLSRTLHRDDRVKVIIFAFDEDQELSRHAATVPAIVEVLDGHLKLTLDDQIVDAQPGSWTYMPADLPHAISATEPSVMLLTMLRGE